MSLYFTMHEFTRSATAERRGIDNTPPAAARDAINALIANILDPLRRSWGRPIIINSGYRSPELNEAVGGAPHSQHMRGEAADITAGSPALNRRLMQCIIDMRLPYDQLIDEHNGTWIHVSYSPRHRRMILKL